MKTTYIRNEIKKISYNGRNLLQEIKLFEKYG